MLAHAAAWGKENARVNRRIRRTAQRHALLFCVARPTVATRERRVYGPPIPAPTTPERDPIGEALARGIAWELERLDGRRRSPTPLDALRAQLSVSGRACNAAHCSQR
jgi:hypothetical protein